MADKAVVLIDGGYFDALDYWLRDERDEQIGFREFSERLCEEFDCDHLRTNFYHSYPYKNDDNPTDDQKRRYAKKQQFFKAVDNTRNHQFKPTGRVRKNTKRCHDCGNTWESEDQQGVDVGIAVDLLNMAFKRTADAFIIVSGDEDLSTAIPPAKDQLCNVYLAFAAESTRSIYVSEKLTTEVDDAVQMDITFLESCKKR